MDEQPIEWLEEFTKFYQDNKPTISQHSGLYAIMKTGAQALFWLRAADLVKTLEQKAREDKL